MRSLVFNLGKIVHIKKYGGANGKFYLRCPSSIYLCVPKEFQHVLLSQHPSPEGHLQPSITCKNAHRCLHKHLAINKKKTLRMERGENAPKSKQTTNRPYLGNTQQNNPLSNPCIKEQDLSMKCLNDNNYDKEACEVYFVNYKTCRAFWNRVIRERRAQGITPYLPLPEERDEIKRSRLATKQ